MKFVPSATLSTPASRRLPLPVDVLISSIAVSYTHLESRAAEYPHQFSGGMKQRVVIAIALACNPKLLIADEPTTALDVTIQAQVLELMKQLIQEREMSRLLITHDLGVVAEVCDDVAVVYAGRIVEKGTADDVFNYMHHPYTCLLYTSRCV